MPCIFPTSPICDEPTERSGTVALGHVVISLVLLAETRVPKFAPAFADRTSLNVDYVRGCSRCARAAV